MNHMRPLEIMKDLFFIERGYLNGNHFVYRGKDSVLIDTAYVSDFSETERLINQVGVQLSDVELIVSTHCHCDHIGGNKIIQERSGCDISLHKVGKHFMDTRDSWSTWWEYYGQDADFFEATNALEDGDIIFIGPHAFEVIYTPGHASDGIVLYHRKEKLLISSDALWEDDMAVITVRVEGSATLFNILASLEKIASLDVKVVFPGHGQPFTNMNGAVTKNKNRIEQFLNNPDEIGWDQLKKITVYTLLMRQAVEEDTFFDRLMETPWFKETVDLYFDGRYEAKYDEIIENLTDRGVVKRKNGRLLTTVKP